MKMAEMHLFPGLPSHVPRLDPAHMMLLVYCAGPLETIRAEVGFGSGTETKLRSLHCFQFQSLVCILQVVKSWRQKRSEQEPKQEPKQEIR